MSIEPDEYTAMNILKREMKDWPTKAQAWHDAIQVTCREAIVSHKLGNTLHDEVVEDMSHNAATRFMKTNFNVETSK